MSNVTQLPLRKDKSLDWLARAVETAVRQEKGDAICIRLEKAEAVELVKRLDRLAELERTAKA